MKNGLSWFDSKKFSITYVLFSVLAWITILIIQIIHKVNYDDQSLTTTVHVIVPVFCGLSLLYALLSNKFKTNWLIALALFFCFLAELLGAVGVPLNVAVFVGCHICLIVYFFKIKPFSKNDLAKLIPILTFLIIYVLFCFLWLIPHQAKVEVIFQIAVPLYGLLLSCMLWRAICTYHESQWLLYSIAGTLFFLSDLNVLLEAIFGFGKASPLGLFIFTWITYPVTITLISFFNRNTLHFVDLTTAV